MVAPAYTAPAGSDCPVTEPRQPGFTPPAPYAAAAPSDDHVWYGSAGLWTALCVDGTASLTKMLLWWSADFGGGRQAEPAVVVRWTQLDGGRAGRVLEDRGRTTNGYTPETGWLMMAGQHGWRRAVLRARR